MEEVKYYIYIKRGFPGIYCKFDVWQDPEIYNVGETYQDYLDGKFVLLSDEQVKFHEDNPTASVKEVFNMELNQLPEYERTIEEAKREMKAKISQYDYSENVNSFTINGQMSAWFTVQERTNYKNSIDSAKLLGVEQLAFFIGDTALTISTELAEKMLAAIQLYADTCFIVTKQHKLAVDSLETIEEVDNYDYTVGYPKKLNFEV